MQSTKTDNAILKSRFVKNIGRVQFTVGEGDGPLSWSHNEHLTAAPEARDDQPAGFPGAKVGNGIPAQAHPQTCQISP